MRVLIFFITVIVLSSCTVSVSVNPDVGDIVGNLSGSVGQSGGIMSSVEIIRNDMVIADNSSEDSEKSDGVEKKEANEIDNEDSITEFQGNLISVDPILIPIRVENWRYAPNHIRVKNGQNVSLELIGISGNHGFAIPELGINASVDEGRSMIISLPTDISGEFSIINSIPVGTGGVRMSGSVLIE